MRDHTNCSHPKTGYAYKLCNRTAVGQDPKLSAHEWAVAVDTVLAQLWVALEEAKRWRGYYVEDAHRMAGHKKVNREWRNADSKWVFRPEAQAAVEAIVANAPEDKPWVAREAQQLLDKLAEADAQVNTIVEATGPFAAEWEELQWNRFFLVTNNNGHIHSSMACSTCRPTTQFAWLPELSGLTEKDAVDAHGTILCSVCFPSAPVEWTLGKQKDTSDVCPGSKTYQYDKQTARRGYYTGNYGDCDHCGQRITLTSADRLRTHKRTEA